MDAQEKSQLEKELLEIVMSEGMVEQGDINPSDELEALSIQSADFILILMEIEERYGAYITVDNDFSNLKTVQDLLDLAIAKIEENNQGNSN